MTMAAFALQVRQMANAYLDHDVADQTKLAGSWDFDLSWTPRGALAAAGPDGISIFDAVEKQMGLKLELQTAPTAVLVVEKVNQKPTPNLPGVGTGSSDGPLEFEAADIKPSAPGSAGFRFLYQNGGRINGEGFLRDFIASAFNVTPNLSADLIVGGPKFLETARYEIVAKTPTTGAGAPTHDGGREAPPPLDVALKMLRSMLEDRVQAEDTLGRSSGDGVCDLTRARCHAEAEESRRHRARRMQAGARRRAGERERDTCDRVSLSEHDDDGARAECSGMGQRLFRPSGV